MPLSYSGVIASAQHRICHDLGVQRGLELRRQVAASNAAEDLSVCVAQTRIASSATSAALVEQFLTDAHPSIVP